MRATAERTEAALALSAVVVTQEIQLKSLNQASTPTYMHTYTRIDMTLKRLLHLNINLQWACGGTSPLESNRACERSVSSHCVIPISIRTRPELVPGARSTKSQWPLLNFGNFVAFRLSHGRQRAAQLLIYLLWPNEQHDALQLNCQLSSFQRPLLEPLPGPCRRMCMSVEVKSETRSTIEITSNTSKSS